MSKVLELSYDQALESLKRAVKEKGYDYVYESERGCENFDMTGTPSCIAGHVYHYHGVTGVGPDWGGAWGSSLASDLVRTDHLRIDKKTETLLTVAQILQDARKPWGESVVAAEQVAASIYPTVHIEE